MYAFNRQLHPPTGMEHCVFCNLMSSSEKNLVVAGINYLYVYRLQPEVETKSQENGADKSADPRQRKQKLECLATFQLFGNVMSIKSVRLVSAPRDSLLISFRNAKLALLEYDPGTHDLKTSSLHCFEEEELKEGVNQQAANVPHVRVDPECRCAVMFIYGTRLVVLPFRRDVVAEDSKDGMMSASKPPLMSSYLIDLRKLDERVSNVIDIQFLHGYYEPTVLILYEPLPTWTGRVAVRKDSCSIVAISLNIQDRVHPIIWSLSNLPFDCTQAFAVPKPIGGVLVFAINSLMYINQSFPPYGVSLNSATDFSTEFLLKPQEEVKISLDAAQADFICFDKMVISLKGGELYVLTLVIDGMRAVRSFHMDKAAASVLTTCMCVCDEGYIFLGSRLGNSLLLKYTEKAVEGTTEVSAEQRKERVEEPPQKKRKDDIGDWMASDVSQIDDLDELEVYGSEVQQPGSQLAQYTFEVCDSIMNIGPCSDMVMGEPAFLSEEFCNNEDPDIELVTTSGYGKNGAISVLQRCIRPQVVTTFELPGCNDMWTVIGPPVKPQKKDTETEADKKDEGGEDEAVESDKAELPSEPELEQSHALLILSREDSSMILQTGQEIMELDHSGFSTQGPTVFAGNIGDNKYVIQVSSMGIRLLQGVNQLQHIPIDVGSPIVCCDVADPHVVLTSEEGHIMLLTLKQDSLSGGVRLAVQRPHVHQNSRTLALCTYRDLSGMFTTTSNKDTELTTESTETARPTLETSFSVDKSTVDDEDDLLYGESDVKVTSPTVIEPKKVEPARRASTEAVKEEVKPTHWAVLARENGTLEIYSLPEFKLCYLVKNFPMGHKVLVDSGQLTDQTVKASASSEKAINIQEMPVVKELLVVGLGKKSSRPHLMARVDDDLYIYEAFPFHSGTSDSHLKLRFKKASHGLIIKAKKQGKAKKKVDAEEEDEEEEEQAKLERIRWLRPFDDISGYSGVFLCGPYPHWLFMSARGILRIHPMGIDGNVTCFTQFHNVNCPKGFLYFNYKGELRISVLPTHLSYDAPWPIRKVPLRCTPHNVLYHPDSKTYSVVTSSAELCNRVVKVVGDGEKEFETQERDERFIYPSLNKFSIQLFSPVSWEPIPNTRLEMEDFEHVTCIKSVVLKCEGTLSGLKGYVAVGTTYCYNEEVTSRGRIVIFDVIEVVPEPGQPLTKNKIKIEYDKEQKGPVTAMDHVQGFLATAIGQKIYIWQLKNQDLSGVAFIDTQIYIHTISSIKNLILVADISKSISLLRFQVDRKVLSLVSKDIKPLEVYNVSFLVDNSNLCFLVADRRQNLLVYTYQPEVRESHGGQRLLRRADINVGSHVNTFFRIRCKLSDPSMEKRLQGPMQKRHITYYATLDGSVGFLLPITEKMYRRLSMVQNALNIHISHYAGLNPKAYKLVQNQFRDLSNPHKNILDGDLLWKYLNLGVMEKNELAKRIGTSLEQIVDDLMEVDRLTAHF